MTLFTSLQIPSHRSAVPASLLHTSVAAIFSYLLAEMGSCLPTCLLTSFVAADQELCVRCSSWYCTQNQFG